MTFKSEFKMNLNTATVDEIKTLVNIGKAKARMVVLKREECQGHLTMDKLLPIPSIPLSVMAENEGNFVFDSVEQEERDPESSKMIDSVTTSSINQDIPVDTKLHGSSQQ